MKLGRFVQSPTEAKRYTVDYTEWLDDAEILAGVPILAITPTTAPPLAVSNLVLNSDSNQALFIVSGGSDGEMYRLDVTATTSASQIKEDVIFFEIEAQD